MLLWYDDTLPNDALPNDALYNGARIINCHFIDVYKELSFNKLGPSATVGAGPLTVSAFSCVISLALSVKINFVALYDGLDLKKEKFRCCQAEKSTPPPRAEFAAKTKKRSQKFIFPPIWTNLYLKCRIIQASSRKNIKSPEKTLDATEN